MRTAACIAALMLGGLSAAGFTAAGFSAADFPSGFTDGQAAADRGDSTAFGHRTAVEVRPGAATRHHDFLRGANATGKPFGAVFSTHLRHSFRFPSASRIGRICPSAYQGVGIASYAFCGHPEIGTPVALYIFQGAEIARLSETLTLDCEWNFGLSAGWRDDNPVVGSRINAYISTAMLLSWHPRPEWTFSLGAGLTHFSNGDTALPNAGMNAAEARVSAVRSFRGDGRRHAGFRGAGGAYGNRQADGGRRLRKHGGRIPEGSGFMERLSLDVALCGAWNAENVTVDGREHRLEGRFGVLALHVNPLCSITRNILAGPAVDIQYNEGVNLAGHVAGISTVTGEIRFHRPPLAEQLAAGLSLRLEIKMPIFAVNIGIGHNLIYEGAELGGFYNLAVLKAFVTERLFIHTGLKICYTEASNNLLIGVGWRL